jgi:hypothetical protein
MVRSVRPDSLLGYLFTYEMASHYRHLVREVLPRQQIYNDSLLHEITLRGEQVRDKNRELAKWEATDKESQKAIAALKEQVEIYKRNYEVERKKKSAWKIAVLVGAPLAVLGLALD